MVSIKMPWKKWSLTSWKAKLSRSKTLIRLAAIFIGTFVALYLILAGLNDQIWIDIPISLIVAIVITAFAISVLESPKKDVVKYWWLYYDNNIVRIAGYQSHYGIGKPFVGSGWWWFFVTWQPPGLLPTQGYPLKGVNNFVGIMLPENELYETKLKAIIGITKAAKEKQRELAFLEQRLIVLRRQTEEREL